MKNESRLLVRFTSRCLFSLFWRSRFADFALFRKFRLHFSIFGYIFIALVVIFLVTVAFEPRIEPFLLHFDGAFVGHDSYNETDYWSRVGCGGLTRTCTDHLSFQFLQNEVVACAHLLPHSHPSHRCRLPGPTSTRDISKIEKEIEKDTEKFLLSKIPLRHPGHTLFAEHVISHRHKAHRFLEDR